MPPSKPSYLEMGRTSMGREEYNYDGLKRNFSITSLSLRSNCYLSSCVLRRLLNICPNIEKLILNKCFTREEQLDMADILGCSSRIRSLELSECWHLKFSKTDAGVSKLRELVAAYSGLGDETLGIIGKTCPALVHLDLRDCNKLTEEGVKEVVRSCGRLRFLSLSACPNVNSDITAWIVSTRPSLRRLTIPAHLLPAKEQQTCFLQGGCVVYRGVDYDELV